MQNVIGGKGDENKLLAQKHWDVSMDLSWKLGNPKREPIEEFTEYT